MRTTSSGIWWQKSWSLVSGCGPGLQCYERCWARRMAKRLAGRCGYPESPHEFDITLHPERLDQPLHWHKPQMIAVSLMGDLFHTDVDDEFRLRVFQKMGTASQHCYVLLTKRPEEMARFARDWLQNDLEPKWYFGVSVEDQRTANERIPTLLQIPAAKRFISYEPTLSSVDFTPWLFDGARKSGGKYAKDEYPTGAISWIICGAETGPGARPADLAWFRSVRDQCQAAGVPFWLKQVTRRGDRVLDDRTWEQVPEVQAQVP